MRKLFLLFALIGPLMLLSCGDEGGNGNPGDTTDPEITILQPLNAQEVAADDVLIRARATDNVGVAKVEFYVGGVKVGEDATGVANVY